MRSVYKRRDQNERKLTVHTKKVHANFQSKRYLCTLCSLRFDDPNTCEAHYRAHQEFSEEYEEEGDIFLNLG